MKEHQRTIEILTNQNIIKDQKIVSLTNQNIIKDHQIVLLRNQKEMIEQHAESLAKVVEELKLKLNKRYLGLFAVTGGLFAVAGLLYIKTHPYLEVREEESDQESDGEVVERPVIEIPDSLECIICMENLKEVMLEPCGHVCICRACAERLRLPSGRVKCPVCRIRAETRTVFIT